MKVLITGGSGLVGTALSNRLLSIGHEVAHLSRSGSRKEGIQVYKWNPDEQYLQEGALDGVQVVVHLAGANIGQGRWTKSRRKEIVDSRVLGTRLLTKALKEQDHQVETVVAASAIGFYGDRGEQWLHEDSGHQPVFLSEVCQVWEEEINRIQALNIRTTTLRIGIVLSKLGGALPKTAMSLNFGLAPSFGAGKQYYSWIHMEDLCHLIETAIDNIHYRGVFNAVAPNPVTYLDFLQKIKEVKEKKALIFPAPSFIFKVVLGEMASIILYSARVSAQKAVQFGFEFKYPDLHSALENIYSSSN